MPRSRGRTPSRASTAMRCGMAGMVRQVALRPLTRPRGHAALFLSPGPCPGERKSETDMSEDNMSEHVMRAVTVTEFGGPEVLTVERVARPEPLPTEVLVRVHAAGVNPVDWKTREGQGMAGLQTFPLILGWDVSGVVEEVGFGVPTLKPGDEVYGMPGFPRAASAYAEYVTPPARHWARKPATLDHVHAA